MRMHRILLVLAIVLLATAVHRAVAQIAGTVATRPVYMPDTRHQNDPLPGGVLAWDATSKSVDATNGQDFARFIFAFTNIATKMDLGQATNISYITNFTIVTNTSFWDVLSGRKYSALASMVSKTNVVTVTNSITPIPVTILQVHPSCGCTTAELPQTPWLLPPGTNSIIKVSVNLAGKHGIVPKTVSVSTDKGKMDLMVRINILPAPPARSMSEEERARGLAAAKIDRQAVFKGDCANCHAKNLGGKIGQDLFAQVCAICHEANPRATMVPDLHHLKDPASEEFWRAWITSGKPGTLMPAFATSQGGPLSDLQIVSLAVYLNQIIPSHVSPPAK